MNELPEEKNPLASAWMRSAPLDGVPRERLLEVWEYRGQRYPVDVTAGKKLDVMALKGASTDEVREYSTFLESVSDRLYAPAAPKRLVAACPCCGRPSGDAKEALRIFSGVYVQCAACGHAFVREQPSLQALGDLFTESAGHSAEYTDADLEVQRFRVEQISRPKLDWAVSQFKRLFAQSPVSLVDVGAGGGHFVKAARMQALDAVGYEKSASSRAFAKQAFEIDLVEGDFLQESGKAADIITFWGLLEYVPEPRRFIAAARERLANRAGMLIVEVPRFNCVGSAAQSLEGAVIARHMDPTSHINCFTDSSLCTALVEEGLKPVAAWYFGMDAYETLIQAALRLDGDAALSRLADMVNPLQAALDAGRQCDDLIIAAVPID